MAKFLNTSGVSFHLEQLIQSTDKQLFLITPYLQLNDRIKENLHNLNLLKKDIRIIYRDINLPIAESNWLSQQVGIRTSFCKNLHAKCYMNDSEAIITSMNLYEFSQVNNNEMGIYITKSDDLELFQSVYKEVQRLLTISEEVRITVEKVNNSAKRQHFGYCISTGVEIAFNPDVPFSKEAYKKWDKNEDKTQNFCHYSGEATKDTTFAKPILHKNWAKAKALI